MTANGYVINGYAVLTACDTWPIKIPGYRGVCRGAWWPLEKYAPRDELARRLNDEWQDELLGQVDQSMPLVSADIDLLHRYAEAADGLGVPLYGLLCASPVARAGLPNWTRTLQTRCTHLGIDISYPSGSYSFLNGAYFARGSDTHEFLRANLNANGLLSTAADARDFLRRYQAELDSGADWETLDDAIPIELWQDSGLSALKRLKGQREPLI